MSNRVFNAPSPLLVFATVQVELLRPEGVWLGIPRQAWVPTWQVLIAPLGEILLTIAPFDSRGNHPIELTFEQLLYTLLYFHVEEYESAAALQEDLADPNQSPPAELPQKGIPKSTFSEVINSRGLEQMLEVFEYLSEKASKVIGIKFEALGKLRAFDGSLINCTLSMEWANYSKNVNKAKAHFSFDLNRGIPRKIKLTEGKGAERPQAEKQLEKGETGSFDRGYQQHSQFDQWQEEDKYFVASIRKNTIKTVVRELPIPEKSNIFFAAEAYLGDENHRTKRPYVTLGVKNGAKNIWITSNRFDLSPEKIAFIYRLRWEIEEFFAWWKKHLNVYHLIARSYHGVMMQLIAGLITYLLLVIYFYQKTGEPPNISLLRQLRRDIRRERALQNAILIKNSTSIILVYVNERAGPTL